MKHYMKMLLVLAILPTAVLAASGKMVTAPDIGAVRSLAEDDVVVNQKVFAVDVPSDGFYSVGFWLIAPRLSDESFQKYNVSVNGQHVGEILSEKPGWHMGGVENGTTFWLNKGRNEFVVSCQSSEIPNVESIIVACDDDEVAEYEKPFDRYMSDIRNDAIRREAVQMPESEATGLEDVSQVGIGDLLYSFFDRFTFNKGKEVSITSNSSKPHIIDVVYVGKPNDRISSGSIACQSQQSVDLIGLPIKPVFEYEQASSAEIQGLNWSRISDKRVNNTYGTSFSVRVPQTGIYLVRLRSREAGSCGTADISIAGLSYEDVPMCNSTIDYLISPREGEVAVFAKGHRVNYGLNPTYINDVDPMLFIHGADGDRIVGFSDDGTASEHYTYGLSARDPFISQRYMIPATSISVSNYSSIDPIALFRVYVDMNYNAEAIETPPTEYYISETPEELGTAMTIAKTGHSESRLTVHDLHGNLMYECAAFEIDVDNPIDFLSRRLEKGVYLITIRANDRITVNKIVI